MCPRSLLILMEKLALNNGSSKQGKAIRASVGSKSVTAIVLWKEESPPARIHKWTQEKKWICTLRTKLIKPRGDIFDFSNYNLRGSRLSFWGKKKEGKILFSSCQLWMHGDASFTYMISFTLMADMDIKAQRIGVTLPGSLAGKFNGSDRHAQSIWGQNWLGN